MGDVVSDKAVCPTTHYIAVPMVIASSILLTVISK